jgi:phosphoribosylformylglycinamidine (FGAM) synthase-like enzyme
MVGRLPDARAAGRLGFARVGDAIALAGWDAAPSLAASELAKLRGEALPDGLPGVDVAQVAGTLAAIRAAVRAGALSSCHDVAEGGLLVAVAECCLAGDVGATVAVPDAAEARLFGERPGGFLISGPPAALEALGGELLGEVGGDALELVAGAERWSWGLAALREAHGALARLFP